MRKFAFAIAVVATLAAGSIGRAAPTVLPATCGGSGPSGLHACQAYFTITEPTAVNINLTPKIGYTGSLKAWLRKGTAPVVGSEVGGYFVAGQATPLANYRPKVEAALLQPGTYTLVVESAKLIQMCAAAWACTPGTVPAADTVSAGDWSAEVVATDAVAV